METTKTTIAILFVCSFPLSLFVIFMDVSGAWELMVDVYECVCFLRGF